MRELPLLCARTGWLQHSPSPILLRFGFAGQESAQAIISALFILYIYVRHPGELSLFPIGNILAFSAIFNTIFTDQEIYMDKLHPSIFCHPDEPFYLCHPRKTSVSQSRTPGPRLSTCTHALSLGPDFRRGDEV
jgi:hypothetical protein